MAAGVRFPDNPDALAVRAERILGRGGLSPSAVVADIHGEATDLPHTNERIIDLSNGLQAWSFLPRGGQRPAHHRRGRRRLSPGERAVGQAHPAGRPERPGPRP
jgi:hypothetical protein